MNRRAIFAFLFVILVLKGIPAQGQTVQFTHHGTIGFAANGNGYDIQLTLFDAPTAGTGTQPGATFQQLSVQMTDGEFTVRPDFGAAVSNCTYRTPPTPACELRPAAMVEPLPRLAATAISRSTLPVSLEADSPCSNPAR